MRSLAETRVTIVGLGLMGGSLALALHGQCAVLHGVDAVDETRRVAVGLGVFTRVAATLDAVLAETDLLVLATPVRAIVALLAGLQRYAGPPLAVLDIGSTKAEIVAAMAELPAQVDGLGGHPMCGKATNGIAHAEAGLYRGATFVLTPLARTSAGLVGLGSELAVAVGAHPVVMTAERHDRLVAVSSHLPYLLAASLSLTADAVGAADDGLWAVTASGFRDTTRLAGSDPTVMADILTTNQSAVRAALTRQRQALDEMIARLDDPAALHAQLAQAQAARQDWDARQEAGNA